MTGIEVNMDGVKYYVTAKRQVCGLVDIMLYLETMRGNPIYTEVKDLTDEDLRKFDKRKAKKFIKRALAHDPKEK